MLPADPARELESPYDVHELPSFEEFDADLESFRQAFTQEMSQWESQGYEAIGVTSHNGRLMGFFKKHAQG